MNWKSHPCQIPLSSPPQILRISGGHLHGLRPIERYRLDKFWCLNLFQGEGELHIGDDIYPFKEGYAGITWPGIDLTYHFRQKTIKTWVHFIPYGNAGEDSTDIPVMQDLGPEFGSIRAELQTLSSLYQIQPRRALARFWDILWQLTSAGPLSATSHPHYHHIVYEAMNEIDMNLSSPLSVEKLAEELHVSQTHLNRLFKSATGYTAGKYIRDRRMETALHLLKHTTMPIKQIAYHVGIPDTQHFNKLIRQYYDSPPTQLRRSLDH